MTGGRGARDDRGDARDDKKEKREGLLLPARYVKLQIAISVILSLTYKDEKAFRTLVWFLSYF